MMLEHMTLDTLRRKRDQEWDMAGLARQCGDTRNELRHIHKAQEFQAEIARRIGVAPDEWSD